MSGGERKVVAVTGASGYIASWLVKLLLERGYTVKASVRDPNDPKKTEHLLSLDGARERLHLLQADLLEEGSFNALVEGCEGVFHTASPVQLSSDNPQLMKVRFSDPSYCEELKQWYIVSKTLAEDAAWKFTEEHGIDMVTINPGLVIGPLLQPTVSMSAGVILNLVNGAESFPNSSFRWVDVRDVAYAHILAFEVPSANGRYCLVGRTRHCSEAISILRELYPTVQFPDKCVEVDSFPFSNFKASNEKAKGLGIKFIPLEVSLKDTVESFKKKNTVSL